MHFLLRAIQRKRWDSAEFRRPRDLSQSRGAAKNLGELWAFNVHEMSSGSFEAELFPGAAKGTRLGRQTK